MKANSEDIFAEFDRLDDEEIAVIVNERQNMVSEPLSKVAERFSIILDEL